MNEENLPLERLWGSNTANIKLNLGCGIDYREGYVNCDWTDNVKVDKIIDLETAQLPFEDNSVDEIIIYHVLEHINNFISLINELHRVCKPHAIIHIKTPFYSAWGMFNDPTHVRFFSPWTFSYFNGGENSVYGHETGSSSKMFNFKKPRINFGIGVSSKLNFLFNPLVNLNHKIYCRFFAWIFPCSEIEYWLEVVK